MKQASAQIRYIEHFSTVGQSAQLHPYDVIKRKPTEISSGVSFDAFLWEPRCIVRSACNKICISLELQLALSVSCSQPHYISMCNELHSWRPSRPFIQV